MASPVRGSKDIRARQGKDEGAVIFARVASNDPRLRALSIVDHPDTPTLRAAVTALASNLQPLLPTTHSSGGFDDDILEKQISSRGRDRAPSTLDFSWVEQQLSTKDRFVRWALENYQILNVSYLVTIVLCGAAVLHFGGGHSISASIFMASSGVSQAGLSVVDFSGSPNITQVTIFCLIILGSPVLITLVPVTLRKMAFYSYKQSRAYKDTHDSLSSGVEELDDIEYGALRLLVRLVLGYWFAVELLGFLFLSYVNISEVTGKPKVWHALYLTTSAFQNNGLTLTPSSLEPMQQNNTVLYAVSFLIILGNTGFPIMLRILTAISYKWAHHGGHTRDRLSMLLAYPRHVYTHMFESGHTSWLLLMLMFLLFLQVGMTCCLDWNNNAIWQNSFTPWGKFANIFFMCSSTRTAGLNSVDMQSFSMPSVFIMTCAMYISTSPVVVTMRTTNVRQEDSDRSTTVRKQAKTYLTQHAVILVVLHVLILLFEKDHMEHITETCSSPEDCDLRGKFSFYKIFFEIVSAYGTVGMSLGSSHNERLSFCADWTWPSQILLCFCMLVGRMRDLPLHIDHPFATRVQIEELVGSPANRKLRANSL